MAKPERKTHYAVLDHTWNHGLRPLCREEWASRMALSEEKTTCHRCLHFLEMRRQKFIQYVKEVLT